MHEVSRMGFRVWIRRRCPLLFFFLANPGGPVLSSSLPASVYVGGVHLGGSPCFVCVRSPVRRWSLFWGLRFSETRGRPLRPHILALTRCWACVLSATAFKRLCDTCYAPSSGLSAPGMWDQCLHVGRAWCAFMHWCHLCRCCLCMVRGRLFRSDFSTLGFGALIPGGPPL